MKVQVRHSFETNSSSSHSLVLQPASTDAWKNAAQWLRNIGPQEASSTDLEFGWKWTRYDSYAQKLGYLFLDGKDDIIILAMKKVAENAQMPLEEEACANLQLFSQKVKEMSNSYSAYIDHQSVGTTSALFRGPPEVAVDLVAEFFASPSYIQGGNDNDDNSSYDYDYSTDDDLEDLD